MVLDIGDEVAAEDGMGRPWGESLAYTAASDTTGVS